MVAAMPFRTKRWSLMKETILGRRRQAVVRLGRGDAAFILDQRNRINIEIQVTNCKQIKAVF